MPGMIVVPQQRLLLENTLFVLAIALYVLGAIGYFSNLFGKKEWGGFASVVLRLAFLVHTFFIVTRGFNVSRVPFVGHFEFSNLFIWATVLVYIWVERRMQEEYKAVGAFLMPLVMIYALYSTFMNRAHNPLPPVLESPWLKIHVTSSVFGYAGISLAFAAAMMWLIKYWLENKKDSAKGSPFFRALSRALPAPRVLEEYMYRAAVFGFLFQTVMIITGAIWADASWGRYWGWDPKEMWSLITWFVLAVYLHARFTRGWTGMRAVALVIVSWVAMMFTWMGVAWLLSGIHSFG